LDEHHHRKKFEQILLNSIDEALSALGENAKNSSYFQQEEKFMIARQDIPYSVEGFSDAIEQIFGLGARHLKILFMKNLHAKVEVTCGPLIDGPVKVDCSRDDVSRACRLIRQNFEAANDDKVEMGVLVNEYEELQK
jgi:adenylyl- and sulfurtransferase ThiI